MSTQRSTVSYEQRCSALVVELLNCGYDPGDDDETRAAKSDRRLSARVALARLVASNLDSLDAPGWTQRPATLPDDDVVVWEALVRARRLGKLADREDRELAQDFRMWREANLRAAEQLQSRLHDVLSSIEALDATGDQLARPTSERLRAHARDRLGLDLRGDRVTDAEGVARRHAFRVCPLPYWVVAIKHPRYAGRGG